MLQNNVEMDLKMRLIEGGQTQTEAAANGIYRAVCYKQ